MIVAIMRSGPISYAVDGNLPTLTVNPAAGGFVLLKLEFSSRKIPSDRGLQGSGC